MKKIELGGVASAKGFQAAGCAAGIKKNGRADMAMIASEKPCRTAGTFTSNLVKAAPVVWDREFVLGRRESRVIVVNSGVANACTGEEGMRTCRETAECCAGAMDVGADEVLVASTGVIGRQLPMDRIREGIGLLASSLEAGETGGSAAAEAIMTTDTRRKETAVSVTLSGGEEIVIGGCCKGSGMIHPNMCTMLCFLTTDAAIATELLQKALSEVVPLTFNMISIDGDTSTNDTCLLLANGMAGNAEICAENGDYRLFKEALLAVCTDLAKMMARDGEGATCLFECRVHGARTDADARVLARSVVSSTLTKAAIAGHDANWGRILCALGYAGAPFDPAHVDLTLESSAGSVRIMEDGEPREYSEELATAILSEEAIVCTVDLREGSGSAEAWGCDLTHEYVSINADYRS